MSSTRNAMSHGRVLRRLLVLIGTLVIAFSASGCATVPAYRRERVADRIMSFGADARVDVRLMKSFDAREGSTGGTGGAGGGCACK
jgi:uncharacterized protein DUF4266